MKILLTIIVSLLSLLLNAQNIAITELTQMPKAISNNAVTEAYINGSPFVFSFGGIDSTKVYSGITNESFRYDVTNDSWDTIPPLPNNTAHIAAAASYVNGIIYIIGGYSVTPNGNEVSSNKVHRYNPTTNSYLTDGAQIPVPIDDHVQAIYKDSLIYVVTGWSNTTNVNNVQIYDTYNDSWQGAVAVPAYFDRVFGSTGTIIGDTIYYYGGANLGSNFPASNRLRKGYINPLNPRIIVWSWSIPSPLVLSYRPACTSIGNTPVWIGGSSVSYNYNGVAYNGSGGVVPSNHIIENINGQIQVLIPQNGLIPMDLRGVASISDSIKYIIGGMEMNQRVSNKTLRVKIDLATTIKEEKNGRLIHAYPNPVRNKMTIKVNDRFESTIRLYNQKGMMVFKLTFYDKVEIDVSKFEKGIYFLSSNNQNENNYKKIIVW